MPICRVEFIDENGGGVGRVFAKQASSTLVHKFIKCSKVNTNALPTHPPWRLIWRHRQLRDRDRTQIRNVLDFCRNLARSAPSRLAALGALTSFHRSETGYSTVVPDLVYQAAELFSQIEEQARGAETRAESLLKATFRRSSDRGSGTVSARDLRGGRF
jgi:hypothetical protein